MKKVILLLLLLPFALNAQEKITISLEGVKAYFPIKNDYYIEKIIDAREQKDSIGIFFKKEERKKIVLAKSLEVELATLVQTQFQKEGNKKPIILKISHLFMTDKKRLGERLSYVEMRMSFILRKEDNTLEELFEASNVNISSDVTYKDAYIVTNLKAVFENCVKDFSVREADFLLAKPFVLSEAELTQPKQTEDHNCYKKPKKKRGLYNNYYDYRDQVLDTAYFFYNNPIKIDSMKPFNEEYVTISEVKMTSLDRKLPWGYCDGENNHINIDGKYYKIYEKDGLFLSNHAVKVNPEYIGGPIYIPGGVGRPVVHAGPSISAGGGIVIAVAVILASVVINEIIEDQKERNETIIGKFSASLMSLNPINGTLTPMNTNYYNKYTVLFDHVFRRVDSTLEVSVDGKKVRTIRDGEFFQHHFTRRNQVAEVCVSCQGKKACTKIENKKIGESNIVFTYFDSDNSLKIAPVISQIRKDRYKDIFKKSSEYKNVTIKSTHYKLDTTELIIAKASASLKSPTKITIDGVEVSAIDQNEYCKLKVVLVEKDPKVCFIDEYNRKAYFKAEDDLGKKVLILLREDANYAMPKTNFKNDEMKAMIESIESKRTMKSVIFEK
jgi:hypothetical protein